MKKLLLALALLFAPSLAFAQCTGVFPPNTICGNLSGSPAPPSAVAVPSSSVLGPNTSTVGHFATWNNITGSLLADFDLFGTGNTFTAGQTFSGANTFSSTNAFNGANTFSALNTFSAGLKYTGLSAGTQANCLGLDSSNNVVTASGACSSGGGGGSGADPDSVTNCTLAASVSGNALTIALKNQAGSDPSGGSPCTVSFRSATATTGTYVSVAVSTALSFSTGTTGSSFGTPSSNVPFRIWITAWNNAGTLVLGVSNQSTTTAIFPINEDAVATSTVCNACTNATSAGVYYTTATQTSKAIRILGYMEWSSGLATAGTWASGPTSIQMFGTGIKKPGDTVQRTYGSIATAVTNSNTYIVSNTLITSANGTLAISAPAITGASGANFVKVYGEAFISNPNSASYNFAYIHNGSVTVSVGVTTMGGAVFLSNIPVTYFGRSSTASTTYSLYFSTSATSCYLNSISGSNQFGGGALTAITVEEIMG